MSRTDDIIDKTKRKEPEAKKWKVVVGIVVGLVLAVSMFMCVWGFVLTPIIDDYVSNSKQIVAVYDFYDLKVGEERTAVYFVGSSIIGCGIDSDEINRILRNDGYNITVYNLGIDGDNALERSLQIKNIIDSNPALVVFGETYNRVLPETWNEESVFLVRDRIIVDSDALYLYSDDELDTLLKTSTIFDNKRFTVSAIRQSLAGIQKINVSASTDMYALPKGDNWRYTEENNPNYKGYEGIVEEANSGSWSPVITNEMTNAKEAVIYNAQTLMDAGIPVVILNMPLHPLISEHVTEESRENFFALLDSTGALWYDYEFACPDDEYWYKDGHHIAPETGAKMFAPQMAELIIELEESNVIHHS